MDNPVASAWQQVAEQGARQIVQLTAELIYTRHQLQQAKSELEAARKKEAEAEAAVASPTKD